MQGHVWQGCGGESRRLLMLLIVASRRSSLPYHIGWQWHGAFIVNRIGRGPISALVVLFGLSGPMTHGQAAQNDLVAEKSNNRTTIEMELQDSVLTIRARDAPLHALLRTISKAADFELGLKGDLVTPITDSFRLGIGEAIKRLVGRNGLVMQYAPADGGGAPRLTRVYVYGPYRDTESSREPAEKEPSPPLKEVTETGNSELAASHEDASGVSPEEAYLEEVCADDARIEECRHAYQTVYGDYPVEEEGDKTEKH